MTNLAPVVALTIGVAAHALAGPLTPPAGTPAPTNKTLQEVEPRFPLADTGVQITIDQPGSYYLTENITAVSSAISILNVDVTLDLNGFSITGSGSQIAIRVLPGSGVGASVTIKNGHVRDFATGVSGSSFRNLVIENVHVRECGVGFSFIDRCTLINCSAMGCLGDGFTAVNQFRSHYINCWAESNGGHGFDVTGQLVECSASFNGENGFLLASGATAAHCVAYANTLDGFDASSDTNLEHCAASFNDDAGFTIADGGAASHCVARGNSTVGFQLTDGGVLDNCTARGTETGPGFSLGNGALVTHCVAGANDTQGFIAGEACVFDGCIARLNGATGFMTSIGCSIDDCVSRQNTGLGFQIGNAGVVTNSAATDNTEDGFQLLADVRITSCTADDNGTSGPTFAGFRGGSDVTIDSCTATDNPIGFVGGVGGLVIRCAAAGNSINWDLTGSDHGAILTPAGTFTSSNAFANISY